MIAPRKLAQHRSIPYVVVGVVTTVVGLLVFAPWSVEPGLVDGGGDGNWLLANYQVVNQIGLFGSDPNLAWPSGYSVWSLPQLGYSQLIAAWVFGHSIGPSMLSVLLLVQVSIMVLCALSVLFLVRSLVGQAATMLSIVISIGVGISPYLTTNTILPHQNVSAFFAIPTVLGLLIRSHGKPWRWWLLGGPAFALIAAMSALWWVFVVLILLLVIGLGFLLQRKYRHVLDVAIAGACVGVGTLTLLVPYALAAVPGEPATRGDWDSNLYGGHLSDFLVTSVAIRELFPGTNQIVVGASVELRFIGLLLVCFAALAVLLLVKGTPTQVRVAGRSVDTRALGIATITTLLLFVSGGLGNLQAAAAVFLGGGSPARVWSRLIVILAVLGMAWFCVYVARWWLSADRTLPRSRAIYCGLLVVLAIVAIYEPLRGSRPVTDDFEAQPEYAAVNFLADRTAPCPVAQLPLDGTPIPRVPAQNALEAEQLMYRGFVPYLINPSFSWSFGSWTPKGKTTLDRLPVALDDTSRAELGSAGFCAVLYDKLLAGTAPSRDVQNLQGLKVEKFGPPSFTSPRYDVYLLSRT